MYGKSDFFYRNMLYYTVEKQFRELSPETLLEIPKTLRRMKKVKTEIFEQMTPAQRKQIILYCTQNIEKIQWSVQYYKQMLMYCYKNFLV